MGFTPSGRYGCEGCHLNVKHHADDGTGTKYVDSADKGWYRFLSGHQFTSLGVKGIEDANWNHQATSSSHNEYLGNPGTDSGSSYAYGFLQNGGASGGAGTVTEFCTGCHGQFHQQESSGVWIRHPSDAVIPDSGEYANISTTYNPNVPVARPVGFNWSNGQPSSTVTPGTDLVMCLSCHVAHGSPYPDMLRWDYSACEAGTANATCGCFVCHTSKD